MTRISIKKINKELINEDERSSLRDDSNETVGEWAIKNNIKINWIDEGLKLNEMSKLGPFGVNSQKNKLKPPVYLKPEYIIQVYYEPLGNPTFHLRHKNNGDKDFFEVRIQIKDFMIMSEFAGNPKYKNNLPQNTFELMIDFFKKPYKGLGISNWTQLINFWNANNQSQFELPVETPIPNVNGFSYK